MRSKRFYIANTDNETKLKTLFRNSEVAKMVKEVHGELTILNLKKNFLRFANIDLNIVSCGGGATRKI